MEYPESSAPRKYSNISWVLLENGVFQSLPLPGYSTEETSQFPAFLLPLLIYGAVWQNSNYEQLYPGTYVRFVNRRAYVRFSGSAWNSWYLTAEDLQKMWAYFKETRPELVRFTRDLYNLVEVAMRAKGGAGIWKL